MLAMTTPSPVQGAPHPAVLVVEDEVLVRLTISAMLENDGFKVIAVSSAEEALQVLRAVPDIRAVVTDVELSSGGMNGFELARRVREEQGIGVVAVSGRVPPENDLPSGVYYLAKPFHRATLVQLVRDMIQEERRPSEQPVRQPVREEPVEAGPEPVLTPRQRTVLELLVQGKSNREIAEAMDLAENTVKVHMAGVFRALGVSSRVEALLAGRPLLEQMQHKADEAQPPSRLS
jgi:DNA-binding NarL/FixJ family response regulator